MEVTCAGPAARSLERERRVPLPPFSHWLGCRVRRADVWMWLLLVGAGRATHLKVPGAPVALQKSAATPAWISEREMNYCHVYANLK